MNSPQNIYYPIITLSYPNLVHIELYILVQPSFTLALLSSSTLALLNKHPYFTISLTNLSTWASSQVSIFRD